MKLKTIHLDSMDGYEFEEFCKNLLNSIGYGRVEQTQAAGDEGRDLIIHDTIGTIFVECKHQPNTSIGRPVVQKLHSALITGGAAQGWIITTGTYSRQAIEYTENLMPPIILIDRKMLFDLASKAGMELVIGTDRGTIYSYPLIGNDKFSWNLQKYLSSILISNPKSIKEQMVLRKRSVVLKPLYSLSYNVDSVFKTTVRQIHHELAQGTMFIEGSTGLPLHSHLQNYFNSAPIDRLSTEGHDDVVIEGFRHVQKTVKDSALRQIISNHTRSISYIGGNNHRYTKECIPKKKDVFLSDISQVYYPQSHVVFELGNKGRYLDICDKGSWDFHVFGDNLSTCEICGKHWGSSALLCSECGSICHTPKIFRKHSFYCKECNMTICRSCARFYTKFLFFKVPVCPHCSEKAQKNGRILKRFKAVS